MIAAMDGLPIDAVLPELLTALERHNRVVLEAPPGAGKSTRVPLALLAADWAAGGRILMLEPRRVAARALAEFLARSRGEEVGATVGYRVRLEQRVGPNTRLEILTEGLLTRRLHQDPGLDGVAAVVFDEFHERHLHGDLALALTLEVQDALRPDLRLVVMSATLDGAALSAWLGAARVQSAGRQFPVQIEYPPDRGGGDPSTRAALAVLEALQRTAGDVLVFLPGKREIEACRRLLETRLDGAVDVLPLHGDLPLADQMRAIRPPADGRRRVVVSSNIAESSLTVPGVRVVVDAGLERVSRFDPGTGMTRLDTVEIAEASATQRAGRAGRLAPGWCLRLWPKERRLERQRRPEIVDADLAGFELDCAAWGSAELRLLDPPPPANRAQARALLRSLGALDAADRITPHGRRLLAWGTHPRWAQLFERCRDGSERALAADLVALLEARDPLRSEAASEADWTLRLETLRRLRAEGRLTGAWRTIDQAARRWAQRLGSALAVDAPDPYGVGRLLARAYPERIAKRDPGRDDRYLLAQGRGAVLDHDSRLRGAPWLAVAELALRAGDARILQAAPLDLEDLRREAPERFTEVVVQEFDADRRAVVAWSERRLEAIVLERRAVDARAAESALLDGLRRLGLGALPWTEALRQWRLRVGFLRRWTDDPGWPELDDAALLATLEDWLGPHLVGLSRLDAITSEKLGAALHERLDHRQRLRLERWAPERLRVPSGLERRIEYTEDAEAVLAVKLQELFGLAATPRLAGGRYALTLHLLSPAGRPIQVTRDLESFWNRTYPEVRKELKGRYPKHPWPEDPWTAPATHRAKPRSR